MSKTRSPAARAAWSIWFKAVQPADGLVEQAEVKRNATSWPSGHGMIGSTCHPPTQSTRPIPRAAGEAHGRGIDSPHAHDAEHAAAQVVGAVGEPGVLVGSCPKDLIWRTPWRLSMSRAFMALAASVGRGSGGGR